MVQQFAAPGLNRISTCRHVETWSTQNQEILTCVRDKTRARQKKQPSLAHSFHYVLRADRESVLSFGLTVPDLLWGYLTNER